jgi:8-oxo-dGTP pyrophosphatase MutT (NUDIX family)
VFEDALRDRVLRNLAGFERREVQDTKLRHAAVAIALAPDSAGEACFLLTKRAPNLRAHSGQWALPGGRLDEGENVIDAVLRELHEEVGLELGESAVLGTLDDYPTRSGYRITPVVLWCGAEVELEPNPDEVAEVYHVRLTELERSDVPRVRSIPQSDRPVLSFPLLGTHIHAPTAAVLYQMREAALAGRSTRVAHFDQPVFAWR